jgi:hypothetical protein
MQDENAVVNETGSALTSVLELALFEWSQSMLTTQAIGRGDYVLTVENFQKLADRLLGIAGSALDVLGEQRLRIAHGMDDQFLIGHADESGDVHARFPSPQPVGAMVTRFQSRQRRLVPMPMRSSDEFALSRGVLAIPGTSGPTGDPREMREVSLGAEP